MRVALFQPDIAGNVGTILRTAACLGVGVDLIEPMGFAYSSRALARAGMDYLHHADVTRHADWSAFEAQVTGRVVLLTTAGATPLSAAQFLPDDVLLLGSESTGVPPDVHARADMGVCVPMLAGRRSLNVAVAGAIVLGEAMRQHGWPGLGAACPSPPGVRC
jgi:tRNA (cytidine/uridine-2'-O-)-methyltransferase